MRRGKFAKTGTLAMVAGSWGLEFDAPEPKGFVEQNGVAVIDIVGPLTHHAECFWDSYESIRERFDEAVNSGCSAIALKIDSPGGDVSGCFELSRHMRAFAKEKGKRLVAYANGMACSAAYAIACAADEIYVPETGFVGSVGVITAVVDQTEADKAWGLRFEIISSGARKADGNPHAPISKESVAEFQSQVNSLAELFFALVAESRSVQAGQIQGLEAAVFHGRHAVKAGLADGVATFDQVLALAAAGKAQGAEEKPMTYEELIAALKEMSENGEGEDKDKASRAIKTLEESEESEEDTDHEEPDGDEAKAEGEEPDGDEAKAKGKASVAALVKAEVKRGFKSLREDVERDRLVASRTDLPQEHRDKLSQKPLAVVKEVLALTPKRVPGNPAAALNVVPTRGSDQGGARTDRLPPTEAHALDVAMGLAPREDSIRNQGTALVLGAMTPAEARARMGGTK